MACHALAYSNETNRDVIIKLVDDVQAKIKAITIETVIEAENKRWWQWW